MERELFAFLGWNVVVREEELTGWIRDVVEPWQDSRLSTVKSTTTAIAIPPNTVRSASNTSTANTTDDRKRRREASNSAFPTSKGSAFDPTASSDEDEPSRHSRAADAARSLLHSQRSTSCPTSFIPPSSMASNLSKSRRTNPSFSSDSFRCGIYDNDSSAPSSIVSSPRQSLTSGSASPVTPVSSGPWTPPTCRSIDEAIFLKGRGEGGIVSVAEW